ncbi:MAG: hypothetical protein B6229_03255 [Spirochaetaceae bacterium 4572_7]|nr:MAG: hypothetical protein B6229_03255 [Spirochaetaceae bacterium 4572_7]
MPFKKNDPNINRNGRPKKEKTLTGMIAKELEKKDVSTSTGSMITRKEAIAKVVTNMAVKGDFRALRMVFEYIDGKPDQRKEIDLSGGLNIPNVTVVTTDEEEDLNE